MVFAQVSDSAQSRISIPHRSSLDTVFLISYMPCLRLEVSARLNQTPSSWVSWANGRQRNRKLWTTTSELSSKYSLNWLNFALHRRVCSTVQSTWMQEIGSNLKNVLDVLKVQVHGRAVKHRSVKTICFLLKTIRAYWSKHRVVTSSSFQN